MVEPSDVIKATASDGELNLDKLGVSLGRIDDDGFRPFTCSKCGHAISIAHHIGPARFSVIYRRMTFELRRPLCTPCRESMVFEPLNSSWEAKIQSPPHYHHKIIGKVRIGNAGVDWRAAKDGYTAHLCLVDENDSFVDIMLKREHLEELKKMCEAFLDTMGPEVAP